jgi:Zn-dependent protease with chaperone function
MPFLLLLLLTLACLPEPKNWPEPLWASVVSDPQTAPFSAALTWIGVILVAGFARAVAVGVTRRLAGHPGQRERVLRRYGRLRTYHVFLLLGVYAVSLSPLVGWGWTVCQVCTAGGSVLPGAEVLLLAPFLAGLVLSWVAYYDAERAIHDSDQSHMTEAEIQQAQGLAAVGLNDTAESAPATPFWSRGAYVSFHVRQNLALVFAPLLLLILMKGVSRIAPETDKALVNTTTGAGIALSLSVFIGLPWLLRLALGLKPLPAGPLRDRLEAAARRLHFRCSNILVWDTHGGVANAMVAGVVPWVRYVLLTDRLIDELTPDEVEAVFGHEVGHVKHHHMLYYLGFLIGSLLLLFLLWNWLSYVPLLERIDLAWPALPLVTMLGAYIFVVFGFLSRRCERQADVYGCRAVSCARPGCDGHTPDTGLAPRGRGLCPTGIHTFIEALEKVARLNGISRDKPGWLSSWQHSTIARRVGFLQDVLNDPALEQRFQWRVTLVKWALLLGLLWMLALLGLGAKGLADKGRDSQGNAPAAPGALDSVTPHTGERTAPLE